MALRSFFRRRTTEQELDRELRFHFEEMEAAAQARPGTGRSADRTRELDRVKEQCRDARTLQVVDEFFKDLRVGSRRLRKNPAFASTAIATIALAIGANIAIFTLLNVILLRPLPAVSSPHDLVLFSDGSFEGAFVAQVPEAGALPAYSFPLYQRLRDELRLFDGVAAQQSNTTGAVVQTPGTDASDGDPASARCVSANYFDVLGVRPLLGRTFRSEDDASPGAKPVIVLSHAYWLRRFGGMSTVVGSELVVNGFPYTVVGVTPDHFIGTKIGAATDFWVPIAMQPQFMRRASMIGGRDATWWLLVIGRSRPGVPLSAATAEVNVVVQRYLSDLPALPGAVAAPARVRADLVTGARGVSSPRRQFGPSLVLLMSGVGLLLLIAGINVSHLVLARGVTRQNEVALELALGATRTRIVRRLITEGVLLAGLGGAAGLAIGRWSSNALVQLASTAQRSLVVDTPIDLRVLAFAALLILAMAVLVGLVPIWRASVMRANHLPGARSESAAGSPERRGVGRLLAVAQVSLSLLLLVGAGLLTQTLRNLQWADKGYREDHVLLVSINSRLTGLNPPQLVPVYEELLDRISSLPVRAVSMAADTPLSGNMNTTDIAIPGRSVAPGENVEAQVVVVSPRYFETMGMRLVEGRGLHGEDRASAPPVAVVNETFARRFFASGRALDQRFVAGGQNQPISVVGVIANAKVNDLRSNPPPIMYLPLAQSPEVMRSLQVRTLGEPGRLAADVRRIIRETNARLAVNELTSLQDQIGRSLMRERLIATLSAAFGLFALVLVCVGLYGVLAQTVVQRRAEIGVRIALGATPHGVQWLILRESLLLTVSGIALGLPLALRIGHAMRGLLFGLSAHDSPILTGVAATIIALVAVAAAYIPAWRASRIDPIVALRCQ
jgi:predicted permease